MRRRYFTSELTDLSPHGHVAWCGEGPEALDRLAALEDLEQLLESGALQLSTVEDVYGETTDLISPMAGLEQLADESLADGYSGMCVVAEDTALAAGTDDELASWIAWEAMVDQLLASRPLGGVCLFDRRRVPSSRLTDIAALHPVASEGFEVPGFQLFTDADATRAIGSLEALSSEQLHRLLAGVPCLAQRTLDVSETEFVDRALLVLNQVARNAGRICLRGAAPIVLRIWDLLDVSTPALEFC